MLEVKNIKVTYLSIESESLFPYTDPSVTNSLPMLLVYFSGELPNGVPCQWERKVPLDAVNLQLQEKFEDFCKFLIKYFHPYI